MIGIEHYLTVSAALFVIGIFGLFLNRKNVIILLMSIELMLLAVNINFVAFGRRAYRGLWLEIHRGNRRTVGNHVAVVSCCIPVMDRIPDV